MIEDLEARLQAVDPAILTDVVRQDQRSPSLELIEWSSRRLSDKGIAHPDGLWLFSGSAHAGGAARPWSVVLKIVERPKEETAPGARGYWKREVLAAQSALLERLPGAMRAPRFYRTEEHSDSLWLWMENVHDTRSGVWTLHDYAFAARQLGRWNGANMARPLPAEPWLTRQPHRGHLVEIDSETVWQSPFHQKYISETTRVRWERLWAERELFCGVLETLPQCLAHFDCQRRNLLVQQGADEQPELVVIDWEQCGVSALGVELHALVGGSTTFGDWPPSAMAALDAAAFEGYVKGLREAGWSGDRDAVRLAYVACMAIFRGASLPGGMAWACSPESRAFSLQAFGLAEAEFYAYLLPVLDFFFDCADEARVLMRKVGMVPT